MAEPDRDALSALFRSNGGDGWLRKDNWDTDAELSKWYGVRVNREGRVVKMLGIHWLKGRSYRRGYHANAVFAQTWLRNNALKLSRDLLPNTHDHRRAVCWGICLVQRWISSPPRSF